MKAFVPGRSDGVRALGRPLVGVVVAIAVTTAMDASGLSNFSALPLFPLMVLFGYLERLPRRSMGFVVGRWRHYGLAVLYPVLVLGVLVLLSLAGGAVDVSQTDWRKAGLNGALTAGVTIPVAILTEEGFFRGWLWASLERAGRSTGAVLAWTSVAFSLWHLSAVTLETGFDLPARQIPVAMLNGAVIGAAWGLMRSISGSVVVSSVSHGLWNGIDYPLFGYGTKVGALGIADTGLYGPETGVLGLALNVAFVAVLWRASQARARRSPAPDPPRSA